MSNPWATQEPFGVQEDEEQEWWIQEIAYRDHPHLRKTPQRILRAARELAAIIQPEVESEISQLTMAGPELEFEEHCIKVCYVLRIRAQLDLFREPREYTRQKRHKDRLRLAMKMATNYYGIPDHPYLAVGAAVAASRCMRDQFTGSSTASAARLAPTRNAAVTRAADTRRSSQSSAG